MYFVVNKGVGMDASRIAPQVAHAMFKVTLFLVDQEELNEDTVSGGPKIILKAGGKFDQLLAPNPDIGIFCVSRTQVEVGTKTVLLQYLSSSISKQLTKLKLYNFS